MKRLVATILVALTVTSCAAKLPPNMSVEGKLAVRGTQVILALRGSIVMLKSVVCQSAPVPGANISIDALKSSNLGNMCLRPEDFIKVLDKVDEAGKIGEQLAVVLRAIDESNLVDTKLTMRQKATDLMSRLSALLADAVILPGNPEARGLVQRALQNVNTLLFAVLT